MSKKKTNIVTKWLAFELNSDESIETVCLANIASDNSNKNYGIGDTEKEALASMQNDIRDSEANIDSFDKVSTIKVEYSIHATYAFKTEVKTVLVK